MLVLVKGAGDLATGAAHRLFRCGFAVVMTEIAQPTVVRRSVSFAEAVYEGVHEVEGVTSRLARDVAEAKTLLEQEEIPVLIDPGGECASQFGAGAMVDAVMAKKNTGTGITDAPLVIGLGPGFTAGIDVHAVVETKRGHNLGRVLLEGGAEPNTGIPGEIGGFSKERLLRAPAAGVFLPCCDIGAAVTAGDIVGYVDEHPVAAGISGLVRGMLKSGLRVSEGFKLGDIDPRGRIENCHTISDKARAIAGGVLEAILRLGTERGLLRL
jgi:xanthine dehydrogenase accessory factor